jgi:hypothetical protein
VLDNHQSIGTFFKGCVIFLLNFSEFSRGPDIDPSPKKVAKKSCQKVVKKVVKKMAKLKIKCKKIKILKRVGEGGGGGGGGGEGDL